MSLRGYKKALKGVPLIVDLSKPPPKERKRPSYVSHLIGTKRLQPGQKYQDIIPRLSHMKIMAALAKTWDTATRRGQGEKVMAKKVKEKVGKVVKKRYRARLMLTVAKEAREIQDMARMRATAVMDRITDIALNSPVESVAVAAGNVVLERAYGRANQTNINAHIDANGKANEIDSKELDARITAALKRVEEATGTMGGEAEAPPREERPTDLRKLN